LDFCWLLALKIMVCFKVYELIQFVSYQPHLKQRILDCSLPKDPGHESKDEEGGRFFYFDSRMKVCQPFTYLGAGGNSNKFSSFKECMSACKNVQQDSVKVVKVGHEQWTHGNNKSICL
jgi:hypothetical protein